MLRRPALMLWKFVGWTAVLCSSSSLLCQPASVKPEDSAAAESTYVPHMTFDVASIRESGEGNFSFIDNVPKNSLFHGERLSAWGLILTAYDVKIGRLLENVPPWAMEIRLDVTAKSDPSTDEALAKLSKTDFYAEKHHMLQLLLADRFKLKIHSETRMSTTYELVTTKQTVKLMTPVTGDVGKTVSTCTTRYSSKGQEVDSKGCPFSIFLSGLRQTLGTTVVDHTGMSGAYAYHLMWNSSTRPPQDDEERYPQLLDAVREQLGLELKETKGPVTFWVVDHIERPTPN